MNSLYEIEGISKQSKEPMTAFTIAKSPELALDSVSSFCYDGVVIGVEQIGSGWC